VLIVHVVWLNNAPLFPSSVLAPEVSSVRCAFSDLSLRKIPRVCREIRKFLDGGSDGQTMLARSVPLALDCCALSVYFVVDSPTGERTWTDRDPKSRQFLRSEDHGANLALLRKVQD
jgi:hypothetical protein